MKIIRPITITEAALTSNVAEDDGPTWSVAATYALGAIVISNHLAYESLVASNTGNPLTNAAKWLALGATNRWRMFDQSIGSLTRKSSEIDVTIAATSVCNGLALLNLDAQQVRVTVTDGTGTIYDVTSSLNSTFGIDNWYSWFTQEIDFKSNLLVTNLPPNIGTSVRVRISGGTTVSCGAMVLGKLRSLGAGPFYGLRGGITDYSRKTTDAFGNTTLVERAYAKRSTYTVSVPNSDIDAVFDLLAQYRATPVVWIGGTDYGMTSLYGWARDWGIVIAYPTQSILSLEIEGLT